MSARVAVVWIPDFPVLACGGPDSGPLAVVYREAVVACSAAARAHGVRRRMRVTTAQVHCPQLRVVERDLAVEMRFFEEVAGHLEDTVLPRLEVIRPGLVAAPARGASRYWGGEPQLTDRLVAAIAERGLPARAGIADSLFTAALAARRGHIVPAGGDAAWLAPYPVGVLGVPRLTELLARLGIRNVGAFARLPAGSVGSRFGADAVAAHRTARGEAVRPLSVRAGRDEYVVAHDFEPAQERPEAVAFAAKTLAEELHHALAGAGVVCARLGAVVRFADGRTKTRWFRHEGRLSSLAVAERVRGVLQAWADDAVLDAGGERGIVRLELRPEGLGVQTGRQSALFGERHTPEEVERAAARIQAILGHRAVVRMEAVGGRAPAEQVRLLPFGDLTPQHTADGPWPGRLPAPYPASTFPQRLAAHLTDASGRTVRVSGRASVSAPPTRLAVEGHGVAAIAGWAGPWPVLEAWWDHAQSRRIARMQIATDDGHAWLLAVDQGRWWAEAHYG
ncbi:DNA polymerase Y family protein [Streptomyces sp. LBUM 1476]|nr:DNA polymerase Y family protein [Streptomyces acidiscabies]MBP5936711.1 DNA polymerase Y family protein [Streptomyces sp. LBUM 1476]MBZ3915287.1 DNA polymerase Y family protein [Streptomyces acidiscabies]MDX3797101.1 DNA polymerase Y family protein [Streptomyces acidiscabies]